MADVEASSKLWKTMDAFGRNRATWIPYWENKGFVRTNSPNVKASLYNRPGKGLIAVVANMGREACSAEVTFDFQALEQTTPLSAVNVMTETRLPLADGRLEVSLESLEHVIVWLKAE